MNRFRTKKRAKDDFVSPRSPVESEPSKPFRMFTKKKPSSEAKKELDLAAALPSTDDFRTSLLMTGLSARFSMLREQDDPNSKLGKASDDSVLFPKRQSRLDFAMSSGLHDIAEVESIRAPFTRMDSYQSDDAASTSGSVMTRGKPTEGNNLFGGRQKIYKITAGGPSKDGMPGRALYENDVALSAFQKWKKNNQQSMDLEGAHRMSEPDIRSDSPPQLDFNRRRETSSTTSSGPRNSTAATSVESSQLGSSVKDWQSTTVTAAPTTSANSTAFSDRTVPRTRRLYEQGLTQDLHDQQTSAQSRFDSASRQRIMGSRTPDLNTNGSSPVSNGFSDRALDRRPMLSKASAPNLRSFSPPTSVSSQASPAESSSKFPGFELKPPPSSTPPLSPPMSEPEDQQRLPIGPNDRGKATAMGVFNRPAQQYDESKYAQRQRQLQQGRETPTNRLRAESNSSAPTSRSRSSSSLHRQPADRADTPIKTEPTVHEEGSRAFPANDDAALAPFQKESKRSLLTPQVAVSRPNDQDHPAFRVSALPTPLSVSSQMFNESPSILEKAGDSSADSRNISPEDSPTLGPTTGVTGIAGLSGMVRQHLRNDSSASSVYGTAPHDQEPESRLPMYTNGNSAADHSDMKSNPWRMSEFDRSSPYDTETSPAKPKDTMETQSPTARTPTPPRNANVEGGTQAERDDFARHLADGARRVRERLTLYQDNDSAMLPPVLPPPDVPNDLAPPPRPSTLGSLKSKSSFGSMIDRNKEPRDQSQTRATKVIGIDYSTTTAAVSSRASAEHDSASRRVPSSQTDEQSEDDRRPSEETEEKDENVHAGLKAFRQARRELQRMKEIEVQQRYHGSSPPRVAPTRERAGTVRAPSQERGPPPVTYNRGPRDESRSVPGSRSASHARSERERSGSEASNSGRSRSRPPYMRNGAGSHEEHHGPNGMSRQSPMMRSPNMPRSEGMQSPGIGAPSTASNASSPGLFSRSDSAQSFGAPGSRGYDMGQPSPSTMNGGDGHNSMDGPYGRRPIRKGDISGPTLMATTSQVPTIPFDGQHGAWSRNGGQPSAAASTPNLHAMASAPPLPPINPRRKNTVGSGFGRQNEEEGSVSSPHLPLSPSKGDMVGMNGRARGMRSSPPYGSDRPPPPATMPTTTVPGGMI